MDPATPCLRDRCTAAFTTRRLLLHSLPPSVIYPPSSPSHTHLVHKHAPRPPHNTQTIRPSRRTFTGLRVDHLAHILPRFPRPTAARRVLRRTMPSIKVTWLVLHLQIVTGIARSCLRPSASSTPVLCPRSPCEEHGQRALRLSLASATSAIRAPQELGRIRPAKAPRFFERVRARKGGWTAITTTTPSIFHKVVRWLSLCAVLPSIRPACSGECVVRAASHHRKFESDDVPEPARLPP
ncbi:hypothetical protein C8R47DRAFT_571777 [Mycena vitilis]|nr:hypothetical protein C8R47DRAFT_571777 [Mycena vitilis]